MKALVFHEPERIAVEDVAKPAPGPGEVLVRVGATGICYSDIRVYRGLKHARPGVIPGHETAGVVAEIGAGVTGVAKGDRVMVCPLVVCGRCAFCRSGRRNRCLERKTLGYDEHGGLAEYLLAPAALVALGHLLPVPDGLPMQRAAATEPLACVLNSLETCGLRPGQSLALAGAGPMGLLHVLLARRLGAGTIIVSEPDEERAAIARRFGASEVVDPRTAKLSEAVLERTDGLGADAVVITAGLSDVLDESMAAVRRQGVVSLFAGFPPNTSVPFDPNIVHYNEIRLTGSQNATLDQFQRTLELLPNLPEIDDVTTHRFALADAAQAYEVRLRNEGLKSMVLVNEGL
ncbi:MAG: alcohol dehydrogenase catalytic domain-containing protein [Dehalococcoidia bacterium]